MDRTVSRFSSPSATVATMKMAARESGEVTGWLSTDAKVAPPNRKCPIADGAAG
jgi:hypothetical protein